MSLLIDTDDQTKVNRLRIDLAQAVIDMAEVKTNDIDSRQAKEKAIEGLRKIRQTLDHLGIRHSSARRCANGRA